jgi:hypothetical protein
MFRFRFDCFVDFDLACDVPRYRTVIGYAKRADAPRIRLFRILKVGLGLAALLFFHPELEGK